MRIPVVSLVRSRSKQLRAGTYGQIFETLEPRTLMTSVPTGAVTTFSRATVSGWAVNADDATAPVNIEIKVNGQTTVVAADDGLAVLPKAINSPFHGFTFSLPMLPVGASKISIVAVSPTSGARKTIKSGTITNPPPVGKVTLASGTRITGWAFDADAGAPIQVRIDIDGAAGVPFTTDVPRNDLLKTYKIQNLGFDVTGDFAGHVVEVFAIDAPTGTQKLLYTNNKLVKGKVEINNGYVVSGWAQDPNDPTAAVSIRVDVDGVTLPGTPVLADGTRADLAGLLGSTDHGFSVEIPGLTPGTHTIAVYAIDGQASSAAPVLLGRKIVGNAAPVGKVELINGETLKGWAYDKDLLRDPTTVNVYVDGQFYETVDASEARPLLAAKFGVAVGPNHGYTVDLSGLSPGSHAITVTAMDNRTSDENEVVLFDSFINNHAPVGAVDYVDGLTIGGWAYDLDAGSDPIAVDVYIDGVYSNITVMADQAREDVDGALPSPNHAYSFTLPALSFGSHKIAVYAAESQGNVSVWIGTKTVVNARPVGVVETMNATTISGWAADPDRLGENVDVQVYINGVLDPSLTTTASGARPDLATVSPVKTHPGFTDYGFSITLPTLSVGNNQIDVYAVDLNSGLLSPLGHGVVVV